MAGLVMLQHTFGLSEEQVVVVDTTVQPMAVEHPMDARLFRKVPHHQLRVADETGTKLGQSHRDLAKSAFLMHGRYMKAKPFKRARGERRKLSDEAWENDKGTLILAELVLAQEKKTKGKVYSMHAPEVERICQREGTQALQVRREDQPVDDSVGRVRIGCAFDGYTLEEQLKQVERLTGTIPKRCHADRRYKGHSVNPETCRVIIAGIRKALSRAIKKEMKSRSGIKPEIGQQKSDGKLGQNWLKGVLRCPERHPLRRWAQPEGDPRSPQATFCLNLGQPAGRAQVAAENPCV